MEWYDKWKGRLPYPVEELHYADGKFRTLIVSNKAIKEAEKLVTGISDVEGRNYYIIGSRGIGKSTTLNYMIRRNLDRHREVENGFQNALFLLCPIPRTVSPSSARELAENIMYGILNGIVQTLQQEEVSIYLKARFPDIMKETSNVLRKDVKKLEKIDDDPTNIVNRILSILSECYPHIFILIDDLDKTENVNLALKALWSYQATFNNWKRLFRVILVISGKEEWVYAFDDIAEYSGIKGSDIILNDWEAEEAKLLVQKRLSLLDIVPVPIIDEAFYELINLGVVTPRGILITSEKILDKAAKLKVLQIGPSLINETLYWNRKRIKELIDFNRSYQEVWPEIRKTIYKNQDLEDMGFGLLIEATSRKHMLPMEKPSMGKKVIPRLKTLKKEKLDEEIFFKNLNDLVNLRFLKYDKKKKAYLTSPKIRKYLNNLVKMFDLEHISEISRIPEIFESKLIAKPLDTLTLDEIDAKPETSKMIDDVIIEYLSDIFKEDPLKSIKFKVLHKEILERKPGLKDLPGDETELFARRLKRLQNNLKIVAPQDGYWKKLHPKMVSLSERISRKAMIVRDKIWSLMEIHDEVLAVIYTKEELERLFRDVVAELGARFSHITEYKDFLNLLDELGYRSEYRQYLNLFFTLIKEELVQEQLEKKDKKYIANRRISPDEYLVESILNPLINSIFPRLDKTISMLRQMKQGGNVNLHRFDPVQQSRKEEREIFNQIFESQFINFYQPKNFQKSINYVMEAFCRIFESLRSRGYIKLSEIDFFPENIGHKILTALSGYIEEGSLYSCPQGEWKVLVPIFKVNNTKNLHILCTREKCSKESCSAFILPIETNLIIATEKFVLQLAKIWMEEVIRLLAEHLGFQTRSGVIYNPKTTVLTKPTEIDVIITTGNVSILIECKNKDLIEADWKDWNDNCDAVIEADKNADMGIVAYTGKLKAKFVERVDQKVLAVSLQDLPRRLEEIWKGQFTANMQNHTNKQ